MTLSAIHKDRFLPVLYASPVLHSSSEQEEAIRGVLEVTSSDSRSAQKAFAAIKIILSGGVNAGQVPHLNSLSPNTKAAGSLEFLVRVIGQDFQSGDVVVINGEDKTTTFVNNGEVRFSLDLSTVTQATVYPVVVRSNSGAYSNTMDFTVTI